MCGDNGGLYRPIPTSPTPDVLRFTMVSGSDVPYTTKDLNLCCRMTVVDCDWFTTGAFMDTVNLGLFSFHTTRVKMSTLSYCGSPSR